MVRRFSLHTPLFFHHGDRIGFVKLECEIPECLDPYSTPCDSIGHVGFVEVIADPNITEIAFSTSLEADSFQQSIPITDARVNYTAEKPYNHTLGVCVQPVFHHFDRILFAQFFEFWLSQGASYFCLYRESWSPEVARVVDLYRSTTNATIDVVDWSELPVPEGTPFEDDPNNYMYRMELMLSVFECVTRARGRVKFLAQMDLDEVLVVDGNNTVAEFMETYSLNVPEMASLSFRSQRVHFDKTALSADGGLAAVNFKTLQEVQLENYIFPRPLYSKVIYRPERVIYVHSHKQFEPELDPLFRDGVTRFENREATVKDGRVLHLRRVKSEFGQYNTMKSDILAEVANVMDRNFRTRVADATNLDAEIPDNLGQASVEAMEACRHELVKTKDSKCYSVHLCFQKTPDPGLVYAKNSWIVV